jgi:hypothetical protein
MSNSETIVQFGANAYGKPATLNILRETIMGRELFDHAFKVYATDGNLNILHQKTLELWKMLRQ